VEGSVRREDVRRSRMARTLTDTDRGRNNAMPLYVLKLRDKIEIKF